LLQAGSGKVSGGANPADAANAFASSGFYQNVLGQTGSGGQETASSTTFLSGGSATGITTANYGYATNTSGAAHGYFMLQPIIVGVGGGGGSVSGAGLGCGGTLSGYGGQGMILIASW